MSIKSWIIRKPKLPPLPNLTDCVHEYLEEIIGRCVTEHVGPIPDVLRSNDYGKDKHQMDVLMWTFCECAGRGVLFAVGKSPRVPIPSFEFDLRVHTLEDWVKLTAPVVRSAVEHCPFGRTFVLFSWQFVQRPGQNSSFGHATLFYFDTEERRQVFFDPSTACSVQSAGSFDYFANNHFWDPGARCEVVDAHICATGVHSLQWYLEPPEGSIPGGSCLSVSLLFLLCSLRFQCTNLQLMVNAMRDSIKRSDYLRSHRLQVLAASCLYKWHASLNPSYMGLWKQRGTLLEVCHIRIPPGASGPTVCGACLTGTTCCPEKPREGWALCDRHLATVLHRPLDTEELQVSLNEWWRHVPAISTFEFPFILRVGFMDAEAVFAETETRIGTTLYRHRCETPGKHKVDAKELVLQPLQHKETYHIVRIDGYLDGDGDHRKQLAALLASVPWEKFRSHSGHVILQLYHRAPVDMKVLVDIVQPVLPVEGWERLVVIATSITICTQSGRPMSDDRLVLTVANGTIDPSALTTFLGDSEPDVPFSMQIISDDLSQDVLSFFRRQDTNPNRHQKGMQLVLTNEPAVSEVAEIITTLGHRKGKLPGVKGRTGLDIVVAPDEPGVRYTLKGSGAHVSGSKSFVEQIVKHFSEAWEPKRMKIVTPPKRRSTDSLDERPTKKKK